MTTTAAAHPPIGPVPAKPAAGQLDTVEEEKNDDDGEQKGLATASMPIAGRMSAAGGGGLPTLPPLPPEIMPVIAEAPTNSSGAAAAAAAGGAGATGAEEEEEAPFFDCLSDIVRSDDIRPHDVLCARGGRASSNPGNARFLAIVERYLAEYVSVRTHKEKQRVANEVMRRVCCSSSNNDDDEDDDAADGADAAGPPGRFLAPAITGAEQDGPSDDEAWCPVHDEVALDKVKMALRNMKKEQAKNKRRKKHPRPQRQANTSPTEKKSGNNAERQTTTGHDTTARRTAPPNGGGGDGDRIFFVRSVDINPNDVLLGRGPMDHVGNVAFHRLADARQAEYRHVKTFKEKDRIANEIIRHIRTHGDPPGRFLTMIDASLAEAIEAMGFTRADADEVWCLADDREVVKKTKRTLREQHEKGGGGGGGNEAGRRKQKRRRLESTSPAQAGGMPSMEDTDVMPTASAADDSAAGETPQTKQAHVKWAGNAIALGTFAVSEAEERSARAREFDGRVEEAEGKAARITRRRWSQ